MKCNLCNSKNYKNRKGSVRDNKNLDILECCDCGLLFLSQNNHINETFYENSNMHQTFDFYKWRNETLADDTRRFKFLKNSLINKKRLVTFLNNRAHPTSYRLWLRICSAGHCDGQSSDER